jgi:hypothetical protein
METNKEPIRIENNARTDCTDFARILMPVLAVFCRERPESLFPARAREGENLGNAVT